MWVVYNILTFLVCFKIGKMDIILSQDENVNVKGKLKAKPLPVLFEKPPLDQ